MLTSLETARGKHIPLAWAYQTLSRDRRPQNLRVPAGSFEVEVFTRDSERQVVAHLLR